MINNKTFLAIIPARGGSKRLPKKNILPLNGKPLILWTIEAALKSKYIDKVIINSENEEVLEIASVYPQVTLYKRPLQLAQDLTPTADVILDMLQNISEQFDYIILLQPTSPLRSHIHIDEAIELLFNKNADAIISVTPLEHSMLWSNTLPENLSMENFLSEQVKDKPSQLLPQYFRLNGAIYICKTQTFLKEKTFFIKKNIFAYIMPKEVSIDIDDKIDFLWAEFLVQYN